MRIAVFPILLVLVASACATTAVVKVPVAVGGSKADATVIMAYDQGPLESVTPNWLDAQRDALKRCNAWGYSRVEQFSGIESLCTEIGRGLAINGTLPGQCARHHVRKTFQCLD